MPFKVFNESELKDLFNGLSRDEQIAFLAEHTAKERVTKPKADITRRKFNPANRAVLLAMAKQLILENSDLKREYEAKTVEREAALKAERLANPPKPRGPRKPKAVTPVAPVTPGKPVAAPQAARKAV